MLLLLEASGLSFLFSLFFRAFAKLSSPNQYGGGGTKTVGMFSKLMSTGSQFVMEGVKNFVVKKHVSESTIVPLIIWVDLGSITGDIQCPLEIKSLHLLEAKYNFQFATSYFPQQCGRTHLHSKNNLIKFKCTSSLS